MQKMMTGKRKTVVGGFFNDKWGDELIKEVALDFGVSETLYEKMDEVA